VPFPGTPLYDRLLEDGRLLEPEAWERCTMFDVNFRPMGMSAATLTVAWSPESARRSPLR
jgi:hypothetical protein